VHLKILFQVGRALIFAPKKEEAPFGRFQPRKKAKK
jgi:hypothetical protein